jgi:hypothetical protein
MKLQLIAGRDFSRDFAGNSVGYLINESALQKIGYKDPIGKSLTFWGVKGTIKSKGFSTINIIGLAIGPSTEAVYQNRTVSVS